MPTPDPPIALTVTVDPTTYRLLVRIAEVEAEEYRRGVTGARDLTVAQIAGDLVALSIRGLFPDAYGPDEPEPGFEIHSPWDRPAKN